MLSTNEGGKSPKAKYEKYIGNDEPLPLDYVDLKIDDTRKATVSWDKPTQGLHQGYIGNLTYNVYRFSSTDTIKVASNLTATIFYRNFARKLHEQAMHTVYKPLILLSVAR